jgi:hypothetical protein
MKRLSTTRLAWAACLALVLPVACGSDDDGGDGDSSSANGDDEGSNSDDEGPANPSSGDDTDTPVSPGVPPPPGVENEEPLITDDEDVTGMSVFGELADECEGITEYPKQLRAPVDIIIVIDNSSSMGGEIEQVEARINDDLTAILANEEVDYRVVLVARYGDVNQAIGESDHPVCIHAPLGANDCSDPNNQVLMQNPPFFYHYSADIRSREPFCDLLEGFSAPDELKLEGSDDRPWSSVAPIGWRQFLREEAFKHFVVISDDDSQCSRGDWSFDDRNESLAGENSAIDFDTALLALSPRQFGTNVHRNYKWHSIVGLPEYSDPLEPWPADEPIQTGTCGEGSEGPGTGFQGLSVLTGGLRYPSCNNENFDAVFRALAETVLLGSFTCEWEIPDVEDFSTDAVNVRWTDSSGLPQVIVNVEGENDCDEGGWYFDDPDDPETVVACPSTCALFQSDAESRVDLLFGCAIVTEPSQAR